MTQLVDQVRKLRPWKVRSAVRRRWFERHLGAVPLERGPSTVELGTAYGGWVIPEGILSADSVCYCVGAGGDVSFDLELIRRYGSTVRCFDPVEELGRQAVAEAAGEPRFSFIQAAIATANSPIRMQAHHHPGSHSVSAAALYDTDIWTEVPGRTLASLMEELGDERIDLLKLDIEGAEYEVLPTLDLVGMGVRIFATQLHHTGSVQDARSLIEGLRAQGYSPIAERPVVKLTFLRDAA